MIEQWEILTNGMRNTLERPGRRTMKRIKHNDLTHYFLRDHRELPASYLRSCRKFFKSIKQQAPSGKPQASSLTNKDYRIIKDI